MRLFSLFPAALFCLWLPPSAGEKACTHNLAQDWNGITEFCGEDKNCDTCPLTYDKCTAKYQTEDGGKDTCNICFKKKQWWNRNIPLECFPIKETRSKIVVIKASEVGKCRNHENDPRSFGQLFSAMFRDHLMTNLMVDEPGEVYLFKTDFKRGLNFPCRREISWCTARHESNITKVFLKDLDTCMNCTCPFGEIGNNDTNQKENTTIKGKTDRKDNNIISKTPNTTEENKDYKSTTKVPAWITLTTTRIVAGEDKGLVDKTLAGAAGGAVGVCAIVLLSVAIFFFMRSRRNRTEEQNRVRTREYKKR